MKYGVDINATTAFFHKLDYDDEAGVRWFLEHGADPNLVLGEQRNTPLHWAICRGRSPVVVKLLLEHGADVRSRRADGKTPYALAVRFGQTETAGLLRQYGAEDDLDIADRFIGACAAADETAVRAMLAADPSLVSSLSAEDKLMGGYYAEVVEALIRAGSPVPEKASGSKEVYDVLRRYGAAE